MPSLPGKIEQAPPSPETPEYWCFISYRHLDNKAPGRQWATWLQQALETYEVPAEFIGTKNQRGDIIPERIFPVFRDEEDLPADAVLSTPIEAALRRSRFLVVICSPQAVDSRFVADEILFFKKLHFANKDRILPVVIAGNPAGSEGNAATPSLPYELRPCFPPALRTDIGPDGTPTQPLLEPLAADFRLSDGQEGFTSPSAFRASRGTAVTNAQVADFEKRMTLMKLKIIAGILGLPLGRLTERDKAYQFEKQKERAKVLRRWLYLVGMFALTAVVAGLLAFNNAQEASRQRDLALHHGAEAEKQREAAEQKRVEAEKAEDRALESEKLTKIAASRSAFLNASEWARQEQSDKALRSLAESLDTDPSYRPARVRLLNMLRQKEWPVLVASLVHPLPISDIKVSGGGDRLFITQADGYNADSRALLSAWDLGAGFRFLGNSKVAESTNGIETFKVSRNAKWVLTGNSDPHTSWIRLLHGSTLASLLPDDEELINQEWDIFGAADFSEDESLLFLEYDGDLQGWRSLVGGKIGKVIDRTDLDATALIAYGSDSKHVVGLDEAGTLHRYFLANGRKASTRKLVLDTQDESETGQPLSLKWASLREQAKFVVGLVARGQPGDENYFWARWDAATGRRVSRSEASSLPLDGHVAFALYTGQGNIDSLICETRSGERLSILLDARPDGKIQISEFANVSYDGQEGRSRPVLTGFVTKSGEDRIAIIQNNGATISDSRCRHTTGIMRHNGSIACARSAGMGRIATGSQDGEVKIWEMLSLKKLSSRAEVQPSQAPLRKRKDSVLLQSNDGRWAVEHKGDSGDEPELVNLSTGRRIPISGFSLMGAIHDVQVNPAGSAGLLVGHAHVSGENIEEGAHVFQIPEGDASFQFLPHAHCKSASFSPDGGRLATVGNGQVMLWNTADWSTIGRSLAHAQVHCATFSSDQKFLFTLSTNGRGVLWDLGNQQSTSEFVPNERWGLMENASHTGETWGAPAISTDGSLVAASFGTAVVIWDVATGQPLCDPEDFGKTVSQVLFTAEDQGRIQVKLTDGSIVKWLFDPLGREPSRGEIQWLKNVISIICGTPGLGAEIARMPEGSHPWLTEMAALLAGEMARCSPPEGAAPSRSEAQEAFLKATDAAQ